MQGNDVDSPVENPSKLYTAHRRIRHIETERCRVTELQLQGEQCIPWHKHTSTLDTFYVMEGVLRISMLQPEQTVEIQAGDTYAVPIGRPHHVQGAAAATFLLMQGIGDCDFVPLPGIAAGTRGIPLAPLFSPLSLGGLGLRNRIVISPMCQYSARDGQATDWHAVHLPSLALSGAGLVFVEATAVSAEGRITKGCLGLYDDACEIALQRVFDSATKTAGVPMGIQLSHSGRKAGSRVPWDGGGPLALEDGRWPGIAPSAIAVKQGDPVPRAMDAGDMDQVIADYRAAACRAKRIGFACIELQMAHGYLMHQFLSPLSNTRTDEFGGSLENRIRFPLEVFKAVRAAVGSGLPLGVRVSATDWVENGWDVEQTAEFALALQEAGCDFIDVSSGGLMPNQKIPAKPGYQVEFASLIKGALRIPVIAVGMITQARQAQQIIEQGQADLVAIARCALYDPRWAWHAAAELGATVQAPNQLHRCLPAGSANIFAHSNSTGA